MLLVFLRGRFKAKNDFAFKRDRDVSLIHRTRSLCRVTARNHFKQISLVAS